MWLCHPVVWVSRRLIINTHMAQEGVIVWCEAYDSETLAGITTLGWRIVKAFSRALDCLPMVVSGGIDGCQIN